MSITGNHRKVIEIAMKQAPRTVVLQHKAERLERLFDSVRGRIRWEGDPVAMRHGRSRSPRPPR